MIRMAFDSKHKSVAELFGFPELPMTGQVRLVHVAIELFCSHGFQAVGVDQILAAAGVTKTTFYKHFESKDDLVVAAIQQRDDLCLGLPGQPGLGAGADKSGVPVSRRC